MRRTEIDASLRCERAGRTWRYLAASLTVLLGIFPIMAASPTVDLLSFSKQSNGIMSVNPVGPPDLNLPGMHIEVLNPGAGATIQVADAPGAPWTTLHLIGGTAQLPFHPRTLSDLWSLQFRFPSGTPSTVKLVPDETLVLVPPSRNPHHLFAGSWSPTGVGARTYRFACRTNAVGGSPSRLRRVSPCPARGSGLTSATSHRGSRPSSACPYRGTARRP